MENLESLKKAHYYFATAVQILSQRVSFYAEEFQEAQNTIHFLTVLRDDAKKKVDEIEPPKEETKPTYNMDLTHVKPTVETVVS
jgi:hypothetical protein